MWAGATTVEAFRGDRAIDMCSNVDVSGAASIPTGEDGSHSYNTIGLGGLKTTIEGFSLYKPVCKWGLKGDICNLELLSTYCGPFGGKRRVFA